MLHRFCTVTALLGLALLPTRAFSQPIIGQNFGGTAAVIQPHPPDTMGAAGIDYFVELNNDDFRVYRKSDGMEIVGARKGINQFWTAAGTTPLSTPFDPRVVYDPHARRWYAVSVDFRQGANNILFAISDSSDPTQSWTGFQIDSDTDDSNWADFPMLGYNADGVYVSANMAPLTAAQTRTSFLAFPKPDLLQPLPSIANMTQFQDVSGTTTGFTPQLTIDASNTFNRDMEAFSMFNTTAGVLQRTLIHGPPGVPQLIPGGQLAVTGVSQPPSVVQPGAPGVQNLEANDSRFSANTVLKGNELYAVQCIDDSGRAAVRFLRIDLTNNAVLEEQIINDPSLALTFPSIAVNGTGDVVVGFTGTSTTEFASSYAVVGKTSGGVTTFGAPMLLQAGADNYEVLVSGRNRWGDYSATTADPADPNIFWTNQEFVVATNRWSTQVTELIVPLPNEARWADPVDGDIDDAAHWQTTHGGAPLATEDVVFSRATVPGGSYLVTFPPAPPGTYMNQTVNVRQGNVVFDLMGNDWLIPLHLEVGPFQGHPQATITNGVVDSTAGFIAPQSTSEGHLTLDNAQWTTNDVQVGSPAASGAVGVMPGAHGGTGSLTIDNNSELHVGGTLTVWEQGSVHLIDGLLSAGTIQHTAPVPGSVYGLQFTGGTLHVDQFNGELLNQGGALAPSGSMAVGTTNVSLRYDQSAGTLAIDIAGAAPGQYDQLIVVGDAVLGELDISYLGGYTPALSDTFDIVNAGSIPLSGVVNLLSTTVFPSTGTNWLDWHVFFTPTVLTLGIVPALTGDFNADGTVDAADYAVWRSLQNQFGFGLAADSNFDGAVDIVDYLAWLSNFGQSIPGPSPVPGAPGAVPEPTGALLVALAALVLVPGLARQSSKRLPA